MPRNSKRETFCFSPKFHLHFPRKTLPFCSSKNKGPHPLGKTLPTNRFQIASPTTKPKIHSQPSRCTKCYATFLGRRSSFYLCYFPPMPLAGNLTMPASVPSKNKGGRCVFGQETTCCTW